MIAEVLFLLGIEYREGDSKLQCGIVAGLLHYTFLGKPLTHKLATDPKLAAFAWMALEGIHLYMSLNQVFNVDNSDKIGYYYGFGYALPLLVVLVTALVQYKSYGSVLHCGLAGLYSTKNNFLI